MIDLDSYIYEHLEDEDFFGDLQDLLDELEPSKETASAILDAIISFDIRELYDTILDDRFNEYVSESKVSELREKYKNMFEDIGDASS